MPPVRYDPPAMRTDELDFHLPPELIATKAAEPRDAARLMVIHRATGQIEHRQVRDLPDLGILSPGDLMLVNQTRVLPAKFDALRAATAGKIRGLFLRCLDDDHCLVMLESRGKLQVGEQITLTDTASLTLIESVGRGEWRAQYAGQEPIESLLARVGQTPLPPYIQKARKAHDQPAIEPTDAQRYNTVFARDAGSVAAPTAGLHFTPELLAALENQDITREAVTLHVGLGTFAPVRSDDLEAHTMHEESLQVPISTIAALRNLRAQGNKTLVVGTTTVRALESLPDNIDELVEDYTASTRLFIRPNAGFEFRFTDRLMTNFHLPKSTLLAMVAALPGVGVDQLKQWYQIAIDEKYRFYSYGDAMLIV